MVVTTSILTAEGTSHDSRAGATREALDAS